MFGHPTALLVLGIAVMSVAAVAGDAARYSARRFTTDDGLPQTRVACMAQTPDGYLWCGTWFGLARFDGVRFVVFDRYNTPAFGEKDAVQQLAVDASGRLWVGTVNSLLRQTDDGFEGMPLNAGWEGAGVSGIVPASGGGVWAASWGGLVRTDGTNTMLIPVPPEISDARLGIPRIVETDVGSPLVYREESHPLTVWFPEVVDDGLQMRVMPSAIKATLRGGVKPAGPAVGGCWVAWAECLFFLSQTGDYLQETLPDPVAEVGIQTAAPARTGGLWIADRRGGIWHWTRDRATAVVFDEGLVPPRGAVALFEDSDGSLWASTDAGLLQLRRRGITSLTTRDGLGTDELWSATPRADGGVWVGGNGGTVARLRGDSVRNLPVVTNLHLGPLTVRSVLETSAGDLLANTTYNVGVHRFEGSGWRVWPETQHYGTALYEDRTGRVWIGGEDGAAWHDGDHWHRWSTTNGLPGKWVRVIHQTADGAMWFGTQGAGLIRLNERSVEFCAFSFTNGLASSEVWAIHETGDGALWIGGNRGLARIGKDAVGASTTDRIREGGGEGGRGHPASASKVFSFSPAHGMADDLVNWILEDRRGFLWLSGLRGIYRVARAELDAVACGEREVVSCATFGVADGMETAETNGEQAPAGCVDSEGNLWFPTGKGVVRIDPERVHLSEHAPVVVLEDVHMDWNWVMRNGFRVRDGRSAADGSSHSDPGTGRLRLSPGQAQLVQFRYTAPTFVSAARARFRYRLRGLSDVWHDAGEERVATFNTLKPGDYTFEVVAANAHGVWTEAPATFAFSLAPSFTQTVWFPASLALCGTALVGSIVMLRLRWQRRSLRAEHAADLAEERARIAQDLHDDLGTALTGVALRLDVLYREGIAGGSGKEAIPGLATHVRGLAARMREVVWAVNPQCDTLPSLAGFLEQQAASLLTPAGIAARFEFPEQIPAWPLDSATRHSLALAVREVLVNCVRHSQAREARLAVRLDPETVRIEICDDGRGFDAENLTGPGQGLGNVAARLKRLGGSCEIESGPNRGTRVVMRIPIQSTGGRQP